MIMTLSPEFGSLARNMWTDVAVFFLARRTNIRQMVQMSVATGRLGWISLTYTQHLAPYGQTSSWNTRYPQMAKISVIVKTVGLLILHFPTLKPSWKSLRFYFIQPSSRRYVVKRPALSRLHPPPVYFLALPTSRRARATSHQPKCSYQHLTSRTTLRVDIKRWLNESLQRRYEEAQEYEITLTLSKQ